MSHGRERSLREASGLAGSCRSKAVSSPRALQHPAPRHGPVVEGLGAAQGPPVLGQSLGGLPGMGGCPRARVLPRSSAGAQPARGQGDPGRLGPLPVPPDVPTTRPPASPSCGLLKAVGRPLGAGGSGACARRGSVRQPARGRLRGEQGEKPHQARRLGPSLRSCLAGTPARGPPPSRAHPHRGGSPKTAPLSPQPGQGPRPLPGAASSLHPDSAPRPEPLTGRDSPNPGSCRAPTAAAGLDPAEAQGGFASAGCCSPHLSVSGERVTQNHRVLGAGRALWGPPVPPPAQAGSPRAAAQHRGQGGWNISREGDSTASLGSLGQGSVLFPCPEVCSGWVGGHSSASPSGSAGSVPGWWWVAAGPGAHILCERGCTPSRGGGGLARPSSIRALSGLCSPRGHSRHAPRQARAPHPNPPAPTATLARGSAVTALALRRGAVGRGPQAGGARLAGGKPPAPGSAHRPAARTPRPHQRDEGCTGGPGVTRGAGMLPGRWSQVEMPVPGPGSAPTACPPCGPRAGDSSPRSDTPSSRAGDPPVCGTPGPIRLHVPGGGAAGAAGTPGGHPLTSARPHLPPDRRGSDSGDVVVPGRRTRPGCGAGAGLSPPPQPLPGGRNPA